MKIRSSIAVISAVLLSFGMTLAASAGTIADCDGDDVPDVLDNCVGVPNGPGAGACSQYADFDDDGYGDACDADFDNVGGTGGTDFTALLTFLPPSPPNPLPAQSPQGNLDCNVPPPGSLTVVTGTDFTVFLGLVGKAQGTKNTSADPGCTGGCCGVAPN
jgi:hypothetical protein